MCGAVQECSYTVEKQVEAITLRTFYLPSFLAHVSMMDNCLTRGRVVHDAIHGNYLTYIVFVY